jgi:hypothetical protein
MRYLVIRVLALRLDSQSWECTKTGPDSFTEGFLVTPQTIVDCHRNFINLAEMESQVARLYSAALFQFALGSCVSQG